MKPRVIVVSRLTILVVTAVLLLLRGLPRFWVTN